MRMYQLSKEIGKISLLERKREKLSLYERRRGTGALKRVKFSFDKRQEVSHGGMVVFCFMVVIMCSSQITFLTLLQHESMDTVLDISQVTCFLTLGKIDPNKQTSLNS